MLTGSTFASSFSAAGGGGASDGRAAVGVAPPVGMPLIISMPSIALPTLFTRTLTAHCGSHGTFGSAGRGGPVGGKHVAAT